MKIKLAFLFAFICIASFAGNGSKHVQKHVKGQIIDQTTGEPLTGVVIKDALTGESVYTDFNGYFSVNFYDNNAHTLEVTFVSYEDKKIVINSSNKEEEITVRLIESSIF